MNTKEIPAATEEVAEIFSLYCSDKLLSDDTPAFALYLAGYKAATSRQDAKVKALVEALEEMVKVEHQGNKADHYSRRAAHEDAQIAIAAAKETP